MPCLSLNKRIINHRNYENVNKGFTEESGSYTWYEFDKEQISTLGKLSRDIVEKYGGYMLS